MSNRKNLSEVWDYMTKLSESTVKCNVCSKIFKFSGTTSNLKNHLKLKHVLPKDLPPIAETDQSPSTSRAIVLPESQPRIAASFNQLGSARKKKLDNLLLGLVTKDMQPFTIVEDKGFREFVQGLDPRYQLPSRKYISSSLLPSKYEETKSKLVHLLKQVDDIAITTDSWTSKQTLSYTTVTGHFFSPAPSWELMSVVLKTIPITDDYDDHSAASLALMMTDVFKECGIEGKVTSIATDNASVMVSCVQRHLKLHHVRCFAHLLNLITKKALSSCEGSTKKKIKALVTYFHSSTSAADKLRSMQRSLGRKERKLVQEVETRWNSTPAMIQRFVEEADAVEGALCALRKPQKGISDDEIKNLKTTIAVLSPFEMATEDLSAEKYTSFSSMIPTLRMMTDSLKGEAESDIRDELIQGLKERFKELEEDLRAGSATFLDPRFKTLYFTDEFSRKIEKFILSMCDHGDGEVTEQMTEQMQLTEVNQEPPTKKKRSLWDNHDKNVNEMQHNSTTIGLSGPELEIIDI